jgi:hypothetical protein
MVCSKTPAGVGSPAAKVRMPADPVISPATAAPARSVFVVFIW